MENYIDYFQFYYIRKKYGAYNQKCLVMSSITLIIFDVHGW